MKNFEIGWFSTGGGEAARQLLTVTQDAIKKGQIKGEITFVFCNRRPDESEETTKFFKLAGSYHLRLVYFSSKDFISPSRHERLSPEWHLEYDREVMKKLEGFHSDFCILAGYMLIISEEMCQKYKMINLHPAAPGGPTGTWREVILKLIENKATEAGVMMHLVTPELDKGPPVTYCTFSIKDDSNIRLWIGTEENYRGYLETLFWDIRNRELRREFPLIIATLKAFSDGKVKIEKGKIMNAEGQVLKGGYDLTEEIDTTIKEKI